MARHIHAAALAAAAALLAACSSGDPADNSTPTPTPTESALEMVTVTSEVRALSIADDDVMTKSTARQAMDSAAVQAVTDQLVELVGAELDARNLGQEGGLSALAAALAAADPAAAAMLASMGHPDNPATDVAATIDLSVDEIPRWATMTLDVTRRDTSHALMTIVIDVSDAAAWQVLLIGEPEDGR